MLAAVARLSDWCSALVGRYDEFLAGFGLFGRQPVGLRAEHERHHVALVVAQPAVLGRAVAPVDTQAAVARARGEPDRVRGVDERLGERGHDADALAHLLDAVRHHREVGMHQHRAPLGRDEHQLARPEVRDGAHHRADVARPLRAHENDAFHARIAPRSAPGRDCRRR
jgi:hypothetical protein